MGIREIIALTVIQQLGQALAAFCAKSASPPSTYPALNALYSVGQQIGAAVDKGCGWGLNAARNEFTEGQKVETVEMADEANVVKNLQGLPPIS